MCIRDRCISFLSSEGSETAGAVFHDFPFPLLLMRCFAQKTPCAQCFRYVYHTTSKYGSKCKIIDKIRQKMPNAVETFPYEGVRKGARKDIRPKRSRRMARRGSKGSKEAGEYESLSYKPLQLDWDGRSGRRDQNGRITAMGPGCDEPVRKPVPWAHALMTYFPGWIHMARVLLEQ